MKPLIWLGSSLDDVRRFSSKARQITGYQLYKIQNGLEPSDWKPMAGIGPGVREIRVHSEKEHRVIYIAHFEEAVYVLHAFIKKTAQTPKGDIDLAARRFRELQISRRGGQ
ncbi:MAG: type II toxin-antitoxin system RelE/ParE family toxin [Nitrospirota bacterium]